MTRLYADAPQHPPFRSGRLRPGPDGAHLVEVQLTSRPDGPEPGEFSWRGRHYLVQEVLARWTQSGQWWQGSTLVTAASSDPSSAGTAEQLDDREQQWWRVEAGSGRAAGSGTGVYDLCYEVATTTWWLARVVD